MAGHVVSVEGCVTRGLEPKVYLFICYYFFSIFLFFDWTIRDFGSRFEETGESFGSTVFKSPGGQSHWSLRCYPRGSTPDYEDCVSLSLVLLSTSRGAVEVACRFIKPLLHGAPPLLFGPGLRPSAGQGVDVGQL